MAQSPRDSPERVKVQVPRRPLGPAHSLQLARWQACWCFRTRWALEKWLLRGLDSWTSPSHLRWLLLLWRQLWTGHQDPEWSPGDTMGHSNSKRCTAIWHNLTALTFELSTFISSSFQQLPASRSVLSSRRSMMSSKSQSEGCRSRDKAMSTDKSSIIFHPQGHWNISKHVETYRNISKHAYRFGPWLRTSVPFTDLTT